jgi:hypothetical protein
MGWIHTRRMRSGRGIGGSRNQRKGPLRKIVQVIRFADGMFDTSRVELECGHEVYSNGQFRARCDKCAAEAGELEPPPPD